MPSASNPFAVETGEVLEYAAMQHGEYAAPSLEEGSPYNDEFGWAATLAQRTSSVETPSAQRLQSIPRRDFRPDPPRPPVEFYGARDRDEAVRESTVEQDADGWEENKGTYKRFAPNPRSTPPEESRPTSRMAPRSYSFLRFFDQLNRQKGNDLLGSARTFNGMHFSMADHRRNYEILGMAPATSRRNTYRLEPAPWDVDIVDLPPTVEPTTVQSRVRSVEIPRTGGTRSWRL